jgi:hypothetical protein
MSASAPCPRTPSAYILPSVRDLVSLPCKTVVRRYFFFFLWLFVHNTQQTPETTIYASSGIQACDPSTQAAAALLTARRSPRSVHVLCTLLTPHSVLCDIRGALGLSEWSGTASHSVRKYRYASLNDGDTF